MAKKDSTRFFSEIRKQLRAPEKDVLPSFNFVMELNDENEYEGVYLVEKNNEKTLGVFYKLTGDISIYIGVIFPSLSQKNIPFFNWSSIYNEVQLTQIHKPTNFLSLESILGGEKADFLSSDYISEPIE